MDKRGFVQSIKVIMEITLAIIVVFGSWTLLQSIATRDHFVREKLARDGALMVDAFADVPDNGWMKYPLDVSRYDISLTASEVQVAATPVLQVHHFPGIVGVVPSSLKNSPDAVFAKNGDAISLASKAPTLQKVTCDGTQFTDIPNPRMKVTKETERVATAALQLSCLNDVCRKGEEVVGESIFIKLIPLKKDGIAANGVVARFPSNSPKMEESREFACQFLNKFGAASPEKEVWLLPTRDADIEMKKGEVAVLLEAGMNEITEVGVVLKGMVR